MQGGFDLSPDARVLAYAAAQVDGRSSVFLTEFPIGKSQWQVASGASLPRFSSDGCEIFFVKDGVDDHGQPRRSFMSTAVTVSSAVTLGATTLLFDASETGPRLDGYDVAPDGRRFLMRKSAPPAPGEGKRIVLVQNWRTVLKK